MALDISILPSSISLTIGTDRTVTVDFDMPSGASYVDITASTSSSSVVTVSPPTIHGATSSSTLTLHPVSIGSATITVNGSANTGDNGTATCVVSVAKPNPTITTSPTLYGSLSYNGSAQKLISRAGVVSNGTMYYYVTTSDTAPTFNASVWSTDRNTITATNLGTYYVWYYVVGASGYNDIGVTRIGSCTMAKSDLSYTAPYVTTSELVYDGLQKELITTAGYCAHGTIYYCVTTSNSASAPTSGWTDNVNYTKRTDANKYFIWYKIVGDYGYNDVSARFTETPYVIIQQASETVPVPITASTTYGWDGTQKALTEGIDYSATTTQMLTTGTFSATAVGTYTVTYTLRSNSNITYSWVGGGTSAKTKTWAITSPEVTMLPTTIYTQNDGQAKAFGVSLASANASVSVSSVSVGQPSPTGITVSGSAGYYGTITLTVTAPAGTSGEYSVPVDATGITVTRNGNSTSLNKRYTVTVIVSESDPWKTATVKVYYNGEWVTATPHYYNGSEWVPVTVKIHE